VKYAWIQNHCDQYSVRALCRALNVSHGGYYEWQKRPPSKQVRRREEISHAARESYQASDSIYGYRKVHKDLQEQQILCSLETVRKVMRSEGLVSRVKRKFVVTTDSNHNNPVAENVLARDFQATGPNQKWAADITYIPTQEGWLYLAIVLDLFSRRIVGWSTSASLETTLVLQALKKAIDQRQPGPGLIHHSDRGSQYTSDAYGDLMPTHLFIRSMSRKGNCWDNAPVESFFGKLKTEWMTADCYATHTEARSELFKYIEIFYNRKRRHAAIDYQSPIQYEQEYAEQFAQQAL
jgi:putative transposase